MIARHAVTALAALALPAAAQRQDDPLTRPLAVRQAKEWLSHRPPVRVFGNSYLVGFGGLSVALIDTGKGLILIDGALPQGEPAILANIRALGFAPRDVKYILSTEPHFDHAGGLAALARDTGATVVASAVGARGLRSGRLAADDPQAGYDSRFPPVRAVRVVRDREAIRLGDTRVTAVATPGHTMGSMSWTWRACARAHCRSIVFASSLNPVSTDDYRFSAPTGRPILAAFRRSQAVVAQLPCDILITAHADQDGATDRFRTTPGACRAYAQASAAKVAARLGKESAR